MAPEYESPERDLRIIKKIKVNRYNGAIHSLRFRFLDFSFPRIMIISLELNNSFPRIIILSLDLHNSFPWIVIRSLDLHNSFSRDFAIRSLNLQNSFLWILQFVPQIYTMQTERTRERIAIRESELRKSRERITNAQFLIYVTIYFCWIFKNSYVLSGLPYLQTASNFSIFKYFQQNLILSRTYKNKYTTANTTATKPQGKKLKKYFHLQIDCLT